MDGWLIRVEGLHARRAPGMTCLSALRGGTMGTIERPLNDSKGCGGVMRAAPIGLVARDEQAAFTLGCEAAAITHGHPSGYYSAGCFAAIIRNEQRPTFDARWKRNTAEHSPTWFSLSRIGRRRESFSDRSEMSLPERETAHGSGSLRAMTRSRSTGP
jgi:ADP-ribosylglycohydrolase